MTETDPSDRLPDDPTDARDARLSEADRRVLDRLAEHGFDPACLESLSISDRRRGERILAQLGLLDAYPDDVPDDLAADPDADLLVDATLARIDREDTARAGRMRIGPDAATASGGWSRSTFRLGDLVAVASVAIIVTTVAIPLIRSTRETAGRADCMNTLRQLAMGLDAYAEDFGGSLPSTAGFSLAGRSGRSGTTGSDPIGSWSRSRNGENLGPLVAGGYCASGDMRCPCDRHTGSGFGWAYRTDTAGPTWQSAERTAVAADRNPLIDLTLAGLPIGSLVLNSENHGGEGQNVLWSDGSIEFLSIPCLQRPGPADHPHLTADNIWIPAPAPPGGEPAVRIDIFLVQ
jgi:hypothetical protein